MSTRVYSSVFIKRTCVIISWRGLYSIMTWVVAEKIIYINSFHILCNHSGYLLIFFLRGCIHLVSYFTYVLSLWLATQAQSLPCASCVRGWIRVVCECRGRVTECDRSVLKLSPSLYSAARILAQLASQVWKLPRAFFSLLAGTGSLRRTRSLLPIRRNASVYREYFSLHVACVAFLSRRAFQCLGLCLNTGHDA